jgi:hypothetical protein
VLDNIGDHHARLEFDDFIPILALVLVYPWHPSKEPSILLRKLVGSEMDKCKNSGPGGNLVAHRRFLKQSQGHITGRRGISRDGIGPYERHANVRHRGSEKKPRPRGALVLAM